MNLCYNCSFKMIKAELGFLILVEVLDGANRQDSVLCRLRRLSEMERS